MATVKKAIIIGGGIAGPAAALALSKSAGISSTIYELRENPATIGGAINLTPNALRVLDHFGVLEAALTLGCPCEKIEMFSIATGRKLGELPFGNAERHGYSSLRICRTDLQNLMLSAVAKDGRIGIQYNKKLIGVEETQQDTITAIFEDGTSASADILLGCDGIHSAVRTQFVDPSRRPTYTGVASAYSIIPTSSTTTTTTTTSALPPVHFSVTAINTSRNGSLLTSYCNAAKTSIFVAAVMEVPEQHGQDGWRARGKVAEDTRRDLFRRFESPKLPSVMQITNAIDDLFFYPVFTLDDRGVWCRGRALLIGDAAHAMSPVGHSVGLALEDAVLLARLLESNKPSKPQDIFPRYEELRRPRIKSEYTHAAQRWEGVKTISWWWQMLREFLFWVYLAYFARHVDESFTYDVFTQEL